MNAPTDKASVAALDSSIDDMQIWWQVQRFMHHEADLLDHREFDAWLELLDEDISYRMPLTRNVRRDAMAQEYSGKSDAAWFDEGIDTLRQRVAQIRTGIHWAEEPASRVSHLVTNIRVLEVTPDEGGGERVRVRSRFLIYQNRLQAEVSLFVGKREDVLRRRDGRWKVLSREIHLDQNVLLSKALTIFF
ncbi:3-phenylpropionate/cinnamic acid dioxygenase subunit beta [Achromobacter sp. RTa]|uniref:3-phenylpropionate/cinnamic acid dioxygenase subunit beta n=1 Tax=Achromobacter sp. RTa TaxID=1532557 RepID=UPI00068D9939|nr:3-phenylpropionate/cinnamic acid dioxygenase subunit beta [Achromobacter sp. RTa]